MEYGHVQCILLNKVVRNLAVNLWANYSGRFRLHTKAENPFKMGYNPEVR